MAKYVPGSCGFPIISDKTIEFVSNPKSFIQSKLAQHSSRIFQARILNNPTIFLCSPYLVKELLIDKHEDFEHGYRSFLHHLYGDLIIFQSDEEALQLHSCLASLFTGTNCHQYKHNINRLCTPFIDSLKINQDGVYVYKKFKSLMTSLCLHLFLGLDTNTSTEVTEKISELATQHWHGIISVPLSIRIPLGGQSTYSRAMQAKEKLLEYIRGILANGYNGTLDTNCPMKNGATVLDEMKKVAFPNGKNVEQHLLLFVSALIPKAFASIVSSFIVAMAGDENKPRRDRARIDPQFLRHVLLEVQRLWPPLFGGRRLAKKNTTLGNFKIPKDYAVLYVSNSAHRDPAVFPEPDKFQPERWTSCNSNQEDLVFCFGAGPRRCVGSEFIQGVFLDIIRQLLITYDWSLFPDEQDLSYKYLPVARPVIQPSVRFNEICSKTPSTF